jgi:hypothetical protein
VKSVTLHDANPTTWLDLSAQVNNCFVFSFDVVPFIAFFVPVVLKYITFVILLLTPLSLLFLIFACLSYFENSSICLKRSWDKAALLRA